MSASLIDVVWSAPEGASSYELHRIEADLPASVEDEPDASVMTADTLVVSIDATGTFEDTSVVEGTAYWYGVRGLNEDGSVASIGWHLTFAVTDDEPPAPIDFEVEDGDGQVLISWTAPAENFQLHGYRIVRGEAGAELETVGMTWNLDQMSFIDPDPPAGDVTYSVLALDFHWNLSEGIEQTVVIEAG